MVWYVANADVLSEKTWPINADSGREGKMKKGTQKYVTNRKLARLIRTEELIQ